MATFAKSPELDETSWQPARLIPVAGIRGQEEQERRATSALLAVMKAVPEFGNALLREAGAPKGRVSTFTEIQLKDAEGKVSIPDGAIVVERGKTRWRALVEVKTGVANLGVEQVGRYVDLARDQGFDAVLTVSSQITANSSELPVVLDRRKTKRVGVVHLSWWRVITEAVLQHRHRGISDPDQAWILGELVSYLEHPNSGASGFEDMGDDWTKVRDGARHGTLRTSDNEVRSTAGRWEQLLEYIALGLSQELGRDVSVVRARGLERAARLDTMIAGLAASGELTGTLKVPDAVGGLAITADLRAQQTTTSVSVDAPSAGRPQSRINWLLRQLENAPLNLRIEVSFVGVRETSAVLLGEGQSYPHRLLCASDPKRVPRAFTITLTRKMGLQRGKGQNSFVRETRAQTLDFYRTVVQNLRSWQAPAPKLPDDPTPPIDPPVVEPPRLALVASTSPYPPPATAFDGDDSRP